MNPEEYYNKEIDTICPECGGKDGEHECECGTTLTGTQCNEQHGFCDDCRIKYFKN